MLLKVKGGPRCSTFYPMASTILNGRGSSFKSSALFSSGLRFEMKACMLPKAVKLY
jgi:hypothetical protein